MPRGDCEGVGSTTRQPCCRRRGGGGGALVEPAALAALLSAGELLVGLLEGGLHDMGREG